MSHTPVSTTAWLIAASALTCVFSGAASAEIYKWISADGVVTYSDAPPPDSRTARTVTTDNVSIVPSSRVSAEEAQILSDRLANRQATEAALSASTGTSTSTSVNATAINQVPRPVIEEPIYYPRVVYPATVRRANQPSRGYEIKPGPYGIGAQAAPISQSTRYRDLPRNRRGE